MLCMWFHGVLSPINVAGCPIFLSTGHVLFSLGSYDHWVWFSSSLYFIGPWANPCGSEQVLTYRQGHRALYAFAVRIFSWHSHRGRRLQVLLTIPWLIFLERKKYTPLHSFWFLPLGFRIPTKGKRTVCMHTDKILINLEYPPLLKS